MHYKEMHTNFWWEELKKTDHQEESHILKEEFRIWHDWLWIRIIRLMARTMVSSSQHDNNPSDSKNSRLPEQLLASQERLCSRFVSLLANNSYFCNHHHPLHIMLRTCTSKNTFKWLINNIGTVSPVFSCLHTSHHSKLNNHEVISINLHVLLVNIFPLSDYV
jgi:hypothetical protein